MPQPLLLTFFGDDNTGSTDSMEALAKSGVNTVLFLDPPSVADVARFEGVQAVGVAGMTRAMSPAEMRQVLTPVLSSLKALGAPLCHYKVCSTFDSAPHVGSIGCAIEVGRQVFGATQVPLLVGAPILRRYTLFGNLFATVGDDTFRIDRHPTMSRHPVTPMSEGDLRVHLAKQTSLRVGLFDILALDGSWETVQDRFASLVAQASHDVVLFDVLDQARLATAGKLIWQHANNGGHFVVGSSGVEYALAAAFANAGLIAGQVGAFAPMSCEKQVLVVSGSCSPVTQAQIDHALAGQRGFAGVDVDAVALLDPSRAEAAHQAAVQAALSILSEGQSPLLYSARGPADQRIAAAESAWTARNAEGAAGRALGERLGAIVRAVLERANEQEKRLRRVVVAGGDTSGHGARRLGVKALKVIRPTAPGSPLCQAFSDDPLVDGLELLLKGGQVGQTDFFPAVRDGRF